MLTIRKTLVFFTFAFVFATLMNTVNAATIKEDKAGNQARLIGVWQLDHAASDSKLSKARFDTGSLPAPIPVAPESLVLAADETLSEITINEGFEKVLHTQTLKLNKNALNETPDKAFWKNGKLVIESSFNNGGKMTRIFELSANKKTLKVTFRVDDARMAKALVVQRVYNRVADTTEDLPAENKATVNIAQVGL